LTPDLEALALSLVEEGLCMDMRTAREIVTNPDNGYAVEDSSDGTF
jgi:hypothetical protein